MFTTTARCRQRQSVSTRLALQTGCGWLRRGKLMSGGRKSGVSGRIDKLMRLSWLRLRMLSSWPALIIAAVYFGLLIVASQNTGGCLPGDYLERRDSICNLRVGDWVLSERIQIFQVS